MATQTSSMIGNHDPSLGHRPIPVMSDADVVFMTQLSHDIVRGVSSISAVRQRGMRSRKRKARDALAAVDPSPAQEHVSHHRHSRSFRDDRTTSSKRLHVSRVIGGFTPAHLSVSGVEIGSYICRCPRARLGCPAGSAAGPRRLSGERVQRGTSSATCAA